MPTWSQLAPNVPTKSTKNRSKRVPHPKPTYIIFSMLFLIYFGNLLGRFLVDFGSQVEGQVDQKSIIWPPVGKLAEISKNLFFYTCFSMFFGPSAFQLRDRVNKKLPRPIKNQAKKLSETWCIFWSIFEPVWVEFGRILAAKLEASWHQMAGYGHIHK